LNAYVHKHNMRTCASEHRHNIMVTLLYPENARSSKLLSTSGIVGPVFFNDIMTVVISMSLEKNFFHC
jgi:hypothetical protein